MTGLRVDAGFFRRSAVSPAQGRDFLASDDVPNGPAVCIISHELWQSQFGARAAGRADYRSQRTDVGSRRHHCRRRLTVPFSQVQVFAPRVFEVGGLTTAQVQAGAAYAQPIARLKPGMTMEQARAELAAFSRAYKERHPGRLDANNISEPRSFVGSWSAGFQPTMYTLLAAAASCC